MTVLAEITNLSVHYGATCAVEGINFEIMAGETLAVIGESGSGKTTIALALAQLLPSSAKISGQICWPKLAHAPVPGQDIGFVFQDPSASFDPLMSVGQQLVETIRAHEKLSQKQAKLRALTLLERVRISDPERSFKRYPHQFSGGQRQRISIALALAPRPRLLIADEPTSALDTLVQKEIIALLKQLVREDGLTLVFITHDIALASGCADRLAVFRLGKLLETGLVDDVILRPQNRYTQALIEATPVLEAGNG